MGFLIICACLAVLWTLTPWWVALPVTVISLLAAG